jgi:hypothetical protein
MSILIYISLALFKVFLKGGPALMSTFAGHSGIPLDFGTLIYGMRKMPIK